MGRSSASGLAVAVFGATGHLGRHVVQRLGRRGAEVIAPVRGEPRDVGALRVMADLGKMHILPFDLRDAGAISAVVEAADVVVNAIATDRHTRRFSIADVNAGAAGDIATAVARSTRRPHLVHVGCVRSSPDAPSEYSRAKHFGEEAVRLAVPGATIVRPATLFGPQDRLLNGIGQLAGRLFGVPIVSGGTAALQPAHVSDVADALVLLIEAAGSPEHAGRTYDLLGPRAYTRRRLAELFAAAALFPPRIASLSPRALWIYSRLDLEILSVPFPYDAVLQMLESDVRRTADNGLAQSQAPESRGHDGNGELVEPAPQPVLSPPYVCPGFADLGFKKLRTVEDSLVEVARLYRTRETYSQPLVIPPHLLEDSVRGVAGQ